MTGDVAEDGKIVKRATRTPVMGAYQDATNRTPGAIVFRAGRRTGAPASASLDQSASVRRLPASLAITLEVRLNPIASNSDLRAPLTCERKLGAASVAPLLNLQSRRVAAAPDGRAAGKRRAPGEREHADHY